MKKIEMGASEFIVCEEGKWESKEGLLVTYTPDGWAIRVRAQQEICWSNSLQKFFREPTANERTEKFIRACRYKKGEFALIYARVLAENWSGVLEYDTWSDSAEETESIAQ